MTLGLLNKDRPSDYSGHSPSQPLCPPFPKLWTFRRDSIIFGGVQNHRVDTLMHQATGARLWFVSTLVTRPTC